MDYSFGQLLQFFGLVCLGTLITRALPFLLLPERRTTPKYIKYLADFLPYTMIGMLVVYCLKDISFVSGSQGIPEFISIAVITVLHLWRKNTLLSIGGGSLVYMILVQTVFI